MPVSFADLLLSVTGDKYAYCKDSIVLQPKPDSDTIPCRDLLDSTAFSSLIERFSMAFDCADRRAIVSMWTLYYFSTLTISVAVLGLELGRAAPASLDEVSVCCDPETAAPQAFLLPHLGPEVDAISIEAALQPMLKLHVEPLVSAISRHSGVGRRMLWTNVAAYLDWIVEEIGRQPGKLSAETTALYKAEIWPGGWKNPVHGLIRRQCDDNGEAYGRRKVCCLRYALPSVGGCGISCPLPQGRA